MSLRARRITSDPGGQVRKIATTTEVQEELRRLIAEARRRPSRTKVAQDLAGLAARLLRASGDSLFDAKSQWALSLAEAMGTRFSHYGGWHDHHVKATHHRTQHGANCELEAGAGWSCLIDINMETEQVFATFTVPRGHAPREGLADLDTLDLNELLHADGTETFTIRPRDPMDKTVMAVSLWLSGLVQGHRR